MSHTKFLQDALNIGELEITLNNISVDDKRALSSYTQAEVVHEAEYVLSTFHESGHSNNDWLNGENGEEENQKEARRQERALRKFISKYKA